MNECIVSFLGISILWSLKYFQNFGIQEKPSAKPLVLKGLSEKDIVFENVGFQYPDGAQIFEDLSMVIRAGKKTAIVGGSGSG